MINYLCLAKNTNKPVIALFGDPLVVFEKLFIHDNNGPFAYLCRSNGSIRTKLGIFSNPLSKIKAIKKGPCGPFKYLNIPVIWLGKLISCSFITLFRHIFIQVAFNLVLCFS